MNKFTKLMSTILALTLLVALPVGAAFAEDYYPLIAGQNTVIGDVTVSNDGINLTVVYQINDGLTEGDGYFLTKTQVYASKSKPKGAAATGAPGQFLFQHPDLHAKSDVHTIPLSGLDAEAGDEIFVAAHANVVNENNQIGVEDPDLGALEAALPASVNIVASNYPNADAYFDTTVTGGSGSLSDGTYGTFCIDETHNIYLGTSYSAEVYSSYGALPESVTGGANPHVDNPDNLDLVNWVINNSDEYTSTEQQNVIWALIDDAKSRDQLSPNEKELYDAAVANGEDFTPGCGDVVAVILVPVNEAQVVIAQVTFAQLGITCDPIFKGDTSWAIADSGTDFRGGWGSYFDYSVTAP